MVTAFVLFKMFVFEAVKSQKTNIEAIKFTLVNLLGLAQVYIISNILNSFFFNYCLDKFWSENISHFLSVGSLTITSFFLHKYFTFHK